VPAHHAPRLGIFGGTFDPPHVGHLVTAVNVRHELDLDAVLFVVANQPWQKVDERSVSPAEDRAALVDAAVAGITGLETSRIEMERGGPSYTVDTLAELARREPIADVFVILGRDAALGVPTWERVGDLADRATLVVVDRPGAQPGPLPAGFRWQRVESPRLEVSSTDLRARVSDGRPLDFLLPDGVIDCIAARGLYGATDHAGHPGHASASGHDSDRPQGTTGVAPARAAHG
jgi:nicotinate-nucleotide adenylyltransferase